MNNIQQQNNFQNTDETQREKLAAYLSGFDQPERASAFLDDILTRHNDEQWAVGGFMQMLDTIANQESLEEVKTYVGQLQVHLLDWTTGDLPESIFRAPDEGEKIN